MSKSLDKIELEDDKHVGRKCGRTPQKSYGDVGRSAVAFDFYPCVREGLRDIEGCFPV